MESGKERSAPLPTHNSESWLRLSDIKRWLEKLGLLRSGHSQQKVLSENVPSLPGDSGEHPPPLLTVPTVERIVKPEIPIPGVAPIPKGNIRLFHFTFPEMVESIRIQGITRKNHKNSSDIGLNAAPNSTWVYSDLNLDNPPGWTIGKPYLEFCASPDEMGPHNATSKEGTARTLKSGIDIPPEKFIAIHEPWHEMVRHSNNGVIDPEWLKAYIDRSVQIAGGHKTRGNYTDYSQMIMQRQYLESQVVEANRYLNFPDNQPELV